MLVIIGATSTAPLKDHREVLFLHGCQLQVHEEPMFGILRQQCAIVRQQQFGIVWQLCDIPQPVFQTQQWLMIQLSYKWKYWQ